MKKEYVTARLFKNHRAEDCLNTTEELCDSDQQQSTECQNHSEGYNGNYESNNVSSDSSLPQRFLSVIRRALELLLGVDFKDKSF